MGHQTIDGLEKRSRRRYELDTYQVPFPIFTGRSTVAHTRIRDRRLTFDDEADGLN